MNEKIASIYQEIQTIETMKKNVREHYDNVIHDKNIPLQQRWDFFVTFDKDYKNTQEHNFIPQSITHHFRDFDWYKNLGYLYNVTINSVCFIQMLEHIVNDTKQLNGYMNNEFYHFYRNNPEQLDNLKEEFLEKNLFSFVNKADNI